jgi:transposase
MPHPAVVEGMRMETRTFRPYDQAQDLLLPPSLRDWLPAGHLAYYISDVVDQLDLGAFVGDYASPEGKGAPPYQPALLLKVLLYGYATGVFSARKLSRKCIDDVAFRFLAAQQTPDFRTLIKFRRRHLDRFQALFVQVVELARELGLVKLGHLSIDGTKVKANASKHKAMSYQRMLEQEQRLRAEIAALLAEAEAVDTAEEAEPDRADERTLPAELARREQRLQAIAAARARLEARARERAQAEATRRAQEATEREAAGEPPKRYRHPPAATPGAREQDNFTDPESRIMLDGGTKGFVQAYNCQVGVDATAQLIVATAVGNNAADVGALLPMVDQTTATVGQVPTVLTADGGYKSEANFTGLEERGIDAHVACGREVYDPQVRAPRGRIPTAATRTERMARKLVTKRGRALYRLRKHIVEPVIGWVKAVLGFRQFSLRGLGPVAAEWTLVCLALNLRRMAVR